MWVGRGIEHDLTAEGRTIGETVRALCGSIQAHSRSTCVTTCAHSPHSCRPAVYWNAFAGGTPVPSRSSARSPQQWDVSVAIVSHRLARPHASDPASAAQPRRHGEATEQSRNFTNSPLTTTPIWWRAITVLDQSPISEGSTGATALRHSVDLARPPTARLLTATG